MEQETLNSVLENHRLWLYGKGGAMANLWGADLRGCDLCGADLRYANLWGANLSEANLKDCDLDGTDLTGANLSGATGLLDASIWMSENLEKTVDGYIAYKSFGSSYPPPATWKIEPDAVISEVVNPLPTLVCACGVNVSTKSPTQPRGEVWKVLIRWEWLPGVVVPYNTDGKFRCSKVQLISKVPSKLGEKEG